MGMTPTYETSKEMQVKIDNYFNSLGKRAKPTISGLCYELGFCSRQSFYDYGKKEEFSYTIKRAKLKIQSHYETQLNYNGCTGAIFALKNFGWSDKQEIEHSGNIGRLEQLTDKELKQKQKELIKQWKISQKN